MLPEKLLLLSSGAFIGGVLSQSKGNFNLKFIFLILLTLIIILWFKKNQRQFFFFNIFLPILIFLAGNYWTGQRNDFCPSGNICFWGGQKLEGGGEIVDWQGKNEKEIYLAVGKISLENNFENHSAKSISSVKYPTGKILMTVPISYSEKIHYADGVKFQGKIKIPENFNGFNYRGYLLKNGIYAILEDPEIKIFSGDKFVGRKLTFFEKSKRAILACRSEVNKKIALLWEDNYYGLIKALLCGDKSALGDDWEINFRKTGVSHIVAISGMHIAIISGLVLKFLSFSIFSRRFIFILTLGLLTCFVVFIGTPASAVRALLMGGLVFLAKYLGRRASSNKILFLTATLMLVFNPLLIFYDVGFQLSFCAVWGLINILPKLNFLLRFFSDKGGLKQVFLASFAAQLATLPLSLYHFNYFSLVSLLANVLVFWVVFPIIILGSLAIFFSFINFSLAQLLAFFSEWGMAYFLKVTLRLGNLSWSGMEVEKIPLVFLIIFSALLLALIGFSQKKASNSNFIEQAIS